MVYRRENSNNITLNVEFNVTEPPVWADNTSDDNSNDNLENEDENNQSGSDNNNNEETDIPSEDDESEITLPTGYEWWCFEGAFTEGDCFVLYHDGNAIRMGLDSHEIDVQAYYFFYGNKNYAINHFIGENYQITDLTQLPSWAL